MNFKTSTLSFFAAIICCSSFAQSIRKAPVHIGLIYPISSNGKLAAAYDNRCSFNAIAGLSHNEHGLAFAGVTNVILNSATGVQLAGFSNHIGGSTKGFQAAGFMNTIAGEAHGMQLAGFANIINKATGVQAAGFTNITKKTAGIQLAGFVNMAHEAKAQIAGFINLADEVKGTQIAGFINVAKKVKGAQVAGLINIADSSEYPVGIINIVKNGEQAIGTTLDETMTNLVTFRSGGRHLYGIIGTGINLKEDNTLFALETGMGLHIAIAKNFRVNAEASLLTLADFQRGSYLKSSVRLLPAYRIGHVELFAGPSFNCVNLSQNTGHALVADYTWQHHNNYGHFTGLYFGGIAGVQFYL